jgi:DsbC/DsbD-like thiol-disulfide interchange protein
MTDSRMQPWRILACLSFFLLTLCPLTNAAARTTSHHLTVQLVSEQASIGPGQHFTVAIHFALEPGWHLYWTNPGDSGEPPRVEWELPAGFTAEPPEWPAPRRIAAEQFVDYGYENELVLLTRLRAPARATGNLDLKANIKWAVCREVCISDKAQLDVSVPVAAKSQPGPSRALFERTRAQIPKRVPGPWRASAISTKDSFLMSLRGGESPIPFQLGVEPVFFPLEKQQIENAAPQQIFRNGNTLQFILKKSEQLTKQPARLKGVVSFGTGNSFLINARVAERE